MALTRVLIMGAAGRDFHNFNVYFRPRPEYRVMAFTATQIPNIEGRVYPAALAGPLYPDGIPIHPEGALERLIAAHRVDQVVFAYSDVSHQYVMDRAARALAAGADFRLMGPETTMLAARVPVVAVTAVRTGAGKSQTTRYLAEVLTSRVYPARRVVAVRHPMPYGRLEEQAVQRFATMEDLERHHCTIEEREEYEPHLQRGVVVYAGVDYGAILEQAQAEADVLLWDGGNNDLPFYRPDVHIVVVDPHRAGHERTYYPGSVNLRMAHVVVINKVDTASPEAVEAVRRSVAELNPAARVVEAESPITVDAPEQLAGRRALVIEDGPTVTHGEMGYGAGAVAARQYGAQLVDPRPFAVGSIADVYRRYSHLHDVLPAMGYGPGQIAELQETINRSDAEVVVVGTPVDLGRLLAIRQPTVRVRYELRERVQPGQPGLAQLVAERLGAR